MCLYQKQYNKDKLGIDNNIDDANKKIPDTSGLVKTDYNAKITDIGGRIPCITGLATTSALNAVVNRYPTLVI